MISNMHGLVVFHALFHCGTRHNIDRSALGAALPNTHPAVFIGDITSPSFGRRYDTGAFAAMGGVTARRSVPSQGSKARLISGVVFTRWVWAR